MQFSFVFLELILNVTNDANHSRQIDVINDIILAAQDLGEIRTIAYFGEPYDIEPYSTAAVGIPKVLLTETFGNVDFNDGAGFNRNIFFIAVGKTDKSALWHHFNRMFAGIQGYARGVFIIRPRHLRLSPNIGGHFEWCWRRGFANVLALVEQPMQTQGFDGYSYTPFPSLNVSKVNLRTNVRLFGNKFSDLRGYKVRTPFQWDPPRVFLLWDRHMQRALLKGYAAEMFLAFLKKHHAGMEIVPPENATHFNIFSIIAQLNAGNVDFAMNPYIPFQGVRLSYPLKMMQWCILVPFSGEIDAYEYFLRPFEKCLWQLCLLSLFYFSIVKGFTDGMLAGRKFHTDFGKAFLDVLRQLLMLPISLVRRHEQHRWYYVVSITYLSALGFILCNLYWTALTSFLAKLIFEQQVDALVDVVRSNLTIHANDYEIPIILNKRGWPKRFEALLKPRNSTELFRDLVDLKPGQAYVAREDLIGFVLSQQSHLIRPRFHVAEECITTVPVGFLIPIHSQFERSLNSFILRAASAGLTEKWFQDALRDGYRAGILRRRKGMLLQTRPLTLKHFQFAWIVLGGGHLLALLSFAFENTGRMRKHVRVRVQFL